jgi:hypothetical protein
MSRRNFQLLVRTTLLWLGVYVAALLFHRDRWVASPHGAVESLCWLAALLLLVSVPAVRAFVSGLPRGHRLFSAVAVAALIFGQLAGPPERTFPVVAWRMFGSAALPIQPFTFFEFAGDTHDGRSVPVNPARLFPSLKNYRMTTGLNKLIGRTLDERAPADSRRAHERQLREVLAAIGRSYSARHPHARLRSLAVVECLYDPAVIPPDARISRRRALTVDVRAPAP